MIAYLAAMAGMTEAEFIQDRRDGLKAIDQLRIFYAAAYIAKKEATQ
jgi:hypothetical protein